MSHAESDLELISEAVSGNGPALEELLLTYHDRLSARIARRLPATLRGTTSEEDILQQAYTEVFQRIGSFEVRGRWAFFRWLIDIADHRLQDAIRAQRTIKRGGGRAKVDIRVDVESDSVSELIEMLAGPERTPSHVAARQEAVAAVEAGLASLGEDRQRAVRLRYLQGLPVSEVAKAMDKTPRAVRNLCQRALTELHAILGQTSQYFSHR